MILLVLAVLSYVALVLETGSGSWSLPAATMPQFVFLTAAVAVLACRGTGAIVWAVIAGLFADVVYGTALGLHVVILANVSFLTQLAGARRWRESTLTAAAFVMIYVAIAGFASVAVGGVLMSQIPDLARLSIASISRAGGTAAVYLVVMLLRAMSVRSLRLVVPRRNVSPDRPNWAQ